MVSALLSIELAWLYVVLNLSRTAKTKPSRPGSCQIVIQMSGKYQEESGVQIGAPPDDLRTAARLTVQRCLTADQQGVHAGGYSTYDFASVTEWITAPNVSRFSYPSNQKSFKRRRRQYFQTLALTSPPL